MRVLFFALLFLSLFACSNATQETADTGEYELFAQRMDKALREGDTLFWLQNLDLEGIWKKARENSDLEFSREQDELKGLQDGLQPVSQYIAFLSKKGDYTLLRVELRSGEAHVLFRLYHEGLINYHEYRLAKKNGGIFLQDLYLFSSGELMSESLPYYVKGLQYAGATQAQDKISLQQLNAQLRLGQYADAAKNYETFPEHLKKKKQALLLFIQASAHIGPNELAQAIAKYRQLYPGDRALPLVSFEPYFTQKNYAAAGSSINALDSIVHDPGLDYFRANLFFAQDSLRQSFALFRKTADNTSGTLAIDARRSALSVLIHENLFAEALAYCKELVAAKVYTKAQLEEELLADQFLFLSLPEVQAWLKDPAQ